MRTARALTGRALSLVAIMSSSILASASPASPQAVATAAGVIPPPVVVEGSQALTTHSAITGQDYVLQVSLPRGYADGTAAFPVIYVLDGQWDFAMVQALNGQQYYDGFIPGAIVVGVTWGGEKPDYDARRGFDLTPSAAGQPASYGNAAKFLAFLKGEAIPLIESKYRTAAGERTLVGSSFGGLFTVYALFNEPELFNRYVLTSPASQWDNASLYSYGEKFARATLARPVRVFMAIGEYESQPGFERLTAALRAMQPKDLEIQTRVIAGAGHSGGKAEGYTRGLQYVFSRPCVTVDEKTLARYAGEYQVDKTTVRLAVEGGRLVAVPPGGGKISLCAETEKDFRVVGQFLRLHAVEDKDGTVSGLRVEQYAGQSLAKRVK
jgi:predicted alpha/beta superfamily hydrolase